MQHFTFKRLRISYVLTVFLFCIALFGCTRNESSSQDNDTNISDIKNSQQADIIPSNQPESIIDALKTEQKLAESQVTSDMYSIAEVEHDISKDNVSIILPCDYFTDADENFDYSAYAKEQGFISAAKNPDDSVTVVMSHERHNALLKSIEVEIKNSADLFINSNDTPHVKLINFSSGFHNIDIYVDKEHYENVSVHTAPFSLAASAMIYQIYAGSERHVHVSIIDYKTKIVLESFIYPK